MVHKGSIYKVQMKTRGNKSVLIQKSWCISLQILKNKFIIIQKGQNGECEKLWFDITG